VIFSKKFTFGYFFSDDKIGYAFISKYIFYLLGKKKVELRGKSALLAE